MAVRVRCAGAQARSSRVRTRVTQVVYGIDKELQEKAASTFDAELEKKVSDWVQKTTGTTFSGDIMDELKSGVVLCALANALKSGSCKAPSTGNMAFKQMENIGFYLDACKAIGVPPEVAFQTVTLYEYKGPMDKMTVLKQINALAVAVGQKL
jgi:transgelin|eukprot:7386005-Prymnesium_polylepis.1